MLEVCKIKIILWMLLFSPVISRCKYLVAASFKHVCKFRLKLDNATIKDLIRVTGEKIQKVSSLRVD